MKTVIKITILMFVLVVTSQMVLNKLIIDNVNSQIAMKKKKYEIHVGKKHITDKDTLTIIDYSIFEETFTLSNGQRVNRKLVDNAH
jgi:uncharacterized protein YxeA